MPGPLQMWGSDRPGYIYDIKRVEMHILKVGISDSHTGVGGDSDRIFFFSLSEIPTPACVPPNTHYRSATVLTVYVF